MHPFGVRIPFRIPFAFALAFALAITLALRRRWFCCCCDLATNGVDVGVAVLVSAQCGGVVGQEVTFTCAQMKHAQHVAVGDVRGQATPLARRWPPDPTRPRPTQNEKNC